jgi:TetR/AcrR family transcriptional regulator, repressor for uid operon
MSAATERVLALAFDPRVITAEDALAERVLDAALDLVAASGFRHLTMDDVARRARVGRMTVYRRFGTRQALIDALAVRECRRCLDSIAASLDPADPMPERLVSLFTATLTVIREHPLLERLARTEPESLLHALNADDSAVFRLVQQFLSALIKQGQQEGALIAGDPTVLAELGIRLGASFVLIPHSALPLDDEAAAREAVRALLAPLTVAE